MNAELKSSQQITVQLAANDTDPTEPVLELERYSHLKRVLRVTAWIKRFIANAKTKDKGRTDCRRALRGRKILDQDNTETQVQPRNKTTGDRKGPEK